MAGRDVIAVVHAGWRGTISNIVGLVFAALGGNCSAACIGPCIGPCCFEVDADVHEQFPSGHLREHEVVDKAYVDLPGALDAQLRDLGVEQIDRTDTCTSCDPDFFSYRRDTGVTGRQAGLAWFDGCRY